MFKTIAKTAAVGSVLAALRRATGRNETHYASSLGLVALGIVVGASAGLLLAPKSGLELRQDMRTRAKKLSERAGESLERVRHNNRAHESNV